MLEIVNLTKSYDKNVKAIKNINLIVEEGDIFGFIGPNGAGKSTTIKCIAGIHSFEEGTITINGLSIKKQALKAKEIMAYVPDNPDLYEHLTGIQYIDFIANIYNVSKEKNELIIKYAKLFDIEDSIYNPIKTYSHGMKQKISLISALIHNPKLIILDEPFVGLDPKASYNLKEILKELCSKGTMVFLSSHVLEVVEKFCNKIAIINNGEVVISGNTNEIIGSKTLESKYMELLHD